MAAAEPPQSPETRIVSKPTTFLSTESTFWPQAWKSRHVRSNRKYVWTKSRRRLPAKFPAIRAVQAPFSCAISLAKGPQCPQYSSQATLVTRIRRPAVTSRDAMSRVSLKALRSSAGYTSASDPRCNLSAQLLRLEQSQLAAPEGRRRPTARNVAGAAGNVRVLAGTHEDLQAVTVSDGFQTIHDLKTRRSPKR